MHGSGRSYTEYGDGGKRRTTADAVMVGAILIILESRTDIISLTPQ